MRVRSIVPVLITFVFLIQTPSALSRTKRQTCLEQFQVRPETLFQGGIMRIDFTLEPGCVLERVSFGDKRVAVKEEGKGRHMMVIGAGLKERPGTRSLVFHLKRGEKKLVETRRIRITKKKYAAEYLKVKKKMVSFPEPILKRVLADQKAVRTACSRFTPTVYWDDAFVWPVESKVLSPFGLRRYFNGQPRSPHSGVDMRAKENTPIRSPNRGRVVLVRDCYLSGNTVVIDHGGGLFTLYAHMSKVSVEQGQMVEKGQVIGLAGSTGRVTGPHLHWGVSLLGQRVDPEMLMRLLGAEAAGRGAKL